jgi:single-stranded-DNA-specific exonuclease
MSQARDTAQPHEARWVLAKLDPAHVETVREALGTDALVAKLLVNRGVTSAEDARRFYRADLSDLSDAGLVRDMPAAVERVVSAVSRREKICIYGDYDVDGVTSVALLLGFLRRLGADVTYYIPARDREGYGLNREAVGTIADSGTTLLVTVDCGISAAEEVAYARGRGMDVIVVDHHQVPARLPEAVALLNPQRADCAFPFKDLAAVGVTFFFLVALRKRLRELGTFDAHTQPNLREHLDLVVLGTVADVVPLLGDNRILAKHGLKELSRTRRPGLVQLKEVSGVRSGQGVSARTVGFMLAPRLNAAGRLEDARFGVELLVTNDPDTARDLAEKLNWQNARRQKIEEDILGDVNAAIGRDPGVAGRHSIVMASESWHPGVIGIVASRLARRFCRPVVLIALKGGKGRGSARSIEGFHMFQGLSQCAEFISEFGGHRSAAGLTLDASDVDRFAGKFEEVVAHTMMPDAHIPRVDLDVEIDAGTVDAGFLSSIERLEPHGSCNPPPLFLASRLRVARSRVVGQGHLKLSLVAGGRTFDAICFGLESKGHLATDYVDIAFSPEYNDWNNTRSIQFRVQDLRQSA